MADEHKPTKKMAANAEKGLKLREKFDQLRKVAAAEHQKPKRQQETDDLFDRAAKRMGITGGAL